MASKFPPESAEIEEQVIALLKKEEDDYLSETTMKLANHFRRHGMTAQQIAFKMGWYHETESGRNKAETPRARAMLNSMVKRGILEDLGASRTLAAGSKATVTFATAGFMRRVAQAQLTNRIIDSEAINHYLGNGLLTQEEVNTEYKKREGSNV